MEFCKKNGQNWGKLHFLWLSTQFSAQEDNIILRISFFIFPSSNRVKIYQRAENWCKISGFKLEKIQFAWLQPISNWTFSHVLAVLSSLQHFHVWNEYINRKLILALKEELELFHNLSPQNWIVFILRKRIEAWQFTWTTTPQRQRLFTPSKKLSTNYQKRFVFSSLVRIKIGYANVFQLATIVLQVFFSYLYWLLSVK